MPRSVIFDLFHTLVDGADPARDQVLVEMAQVVGVDPERLVAAYHESWPDRLLGGDVAETVRILSRRVGGDPPPDRVAQAVGLRRAFAARALAAVTPATLAVLDKLRDAGYQLGLISNATSDSAEAWPTSPLADRFEVAVFSCEVGLAKPDPRIYQLAAERLGVAPAECFFVGDGADAELAGAAAVGMTALRTTEHHHSDPHWDGPTLTSLADLPVALSAASPALHRVAGRPLRD